MNQPLIDAHHHLFELSRFAQPWIDDDMAAIDRDFTLDDFGRATADVALMGSVLVQTVAEADETPFMLDLAHSSEVVLGVVGWCDLRAPEVADRIAELSELPAGGALVGIRHVVQGESDPSWLDLHDVRRGVNAVGDASLVFDLLVGPPQWDAALRIARELPEVEFVLDHLGKPSLHAGIDLTGWQTFLIDLAACPNVSAKVSGLATEADWEHWSADDLRPAVETAWSSFGADRLMFASDWPVCTLATGYDDWFAAIDQLISGASPSERAAFFEGTARRCYGLTTEHPVP